MAVPDLTDPELREELARASYYQDKQDLVAADREHDTAPAEYFCLRWEQVSAEGQAPYRAAVKTTLDHVSELIAV